MALPDNSAANASANGTYRQQLVDSMVFELIPLKSVDAAIEALPPNSPVSVTASPVKGLDATKELSDRIRSKGHRPTPTLRHAWSKDPSMCAALRNGSRPKVTKRSFALPVMPKNQRDPTKAPTRS